MLWRCFLPPRDSVLGSVWCGLEMSFNGTAVLQIKTGAVFSYHWTEFPRWTGHRPVSLLLSSPPWLISSHSTEWNASSSEEGSFQWGWRENISNLDKTEDEGSGGFQVAQRKQMHPIEQVLFEWVSTFCHRTFWGPLVKCLQEEKNWIKQPGGKLK